MSLATGQLEVAANHAKDIFPITTMFAVTSSYPRSIKNKRAANFR